MQHILECAGGVSLRELLPGSRIIGGTDVRTRSCSSDWRSCRPGDLFVALDDGVTDGHDDVERAVARGASAVLVERLLPTDVPNCIVPDTREAYGQLCQSLAGNPCQHLRVVGVSGSRGKTTTSLLLAAILEKAERHVGSLNSLIYSDGLDAVAATSSTPTPPEMARWLARMAASGCETGVIEISSRGLATRRIAGIELDAVILTNLRGCGLGVQGSVITQRRAQLRLLDHLKPHGFVVINADDPGSSALLPKIEQPTITIALHHDAEVTATVVERCASEQTFLLMAGSETVPVRTRIIGDWHVYNCLSAAAAALVMNVPLTTIAAGLETVDAIPGRLQRIECGQPYSVFVDEACTPDALAGTLKTLRQVTSGRLIVLFGAPQNDDDRPLLGSVAERGSDLSIITSNSLDHKTTLAVLHDVLDGYACPGAPHLMPDRRRAIRWALDQAQPGDTVLIAGGELPGNSDGWSTSSDSEIARQWLYEEHENHS